MKVVKTKPELTHSQCINRAAVWLSNRPANSDLRCKIILTEMTGYGGNLYGSEIPDILGLWGSQSTVNIECKVSRADFFNDVKKRHKHPYGNYKFYACPSGLIDQSEIPEEFGLLYAANSGCRLIKEPIYTTENVKDVMPMLCDLILNARMSGVLTATHKKRDRQWDGKAVIL